MTTIYNFFDEYRKKIIFISELIFTTSILVLIALINDNQNLIGTYPYKLTVSIMFAFGFLTYLLKNLTPSDLFKEVISKSCFILVPAIFIFKLTNNLELSEMYNLLYSVIIIFVFSFYNRKSTWRINGEDKKITSQEYLSENFGKTASIWPSLLLFLGILLPGVFNFSTMWFIFSLIIAFVIEMIIVSLLYKYKRLVAN